MSELRLAVGPGLGRVVRRSGAVLFDAEGAGPDLAAGFVDAPSDSEAIRAVKQQLIDKGASTTPLLLVGWNAAPGAARREVSLLVVGDVVASTSVPSAGLVTGTGSQTWVERHLGDLELARLDSIEIWAGAQADASTNLTLGAVLGGGFRLTLPLDVESIEAVPEEPRPAAPRSAAPPVARPPAAPVPPAPAPPAPAPAPPAPPVYAPPVHEPTVDDEWGDTEDQEPRQDPAPDPFMPAPSLGLVEATMCERGHSNPPGASSCFSCGLSIGAEPNWTVIEQPTVGRLVFVDGQVIPIDRRVVIGRKPVVEEGHSLAVTIDQAEVSRSHAVVTVEGWTVLLTDLGSRNGTYVCPPDTSTPIRLDEGVQHFLEDGTTVHLGGPDASFTFEGQTP